MINNDKGEAKTGAGCLILILAIIAVALIAALATPGVLR